MPQTVLMNEKLVTAECLSRPVDVRWCVDTLRLEDPWILMPSGVHEMLWRLPTGDDWNQDVVISMDVEGKFSKCED